MLWGDGDERMIINDIAYEIIERLYPDLKKLEMYARAEKQPKKEVWAGAADKKIAIYEIN